MATLVFNGHDLSGTTTNRPDNVESGQLYYNTTTGSLQVYTGSAWQEAGDVASGDITAGSITGGDSSLGITGQAASDGGGAGGAVVLSGAAGDATTDATTGGAGGAASVVSGDGGANTGGATGEAGGAGGATAVTAGDGGATNSTGAHAGGAGGAVTITGGAGGNASAGSGDGGSGGDVTLSPGSGGTSSGGSSGANGEVKVSGTPLSFADAQTIDMDNSQVALTRVPGTPSGTEVTSNVLYVDANSGDTEDLLLPPEADCNGLTLVIVNTGGEDIIVKEDGDSTTICTISTNEIGLVTCDGTTWRGGIMATT